MISVVTVDGRADETDMLKNIIPDTAAVLTEERWEKFYFDNMREWLSFLETEPLMDFECFDVAMEGLLSSLKRVRSSYADMGIMLIADSSTSPLEYLRPGIRADTLIIRPVKYELLKEAVDNLVADGLERMKRHDGEDSFVLETREGRTFIPYDNIYYFEAREKKIFVNTIENEIPFYSTIDDLANALPAQFSRCHRSYIVNINKIKKIVSTENMIELSSGFTVPFSRTYKSQIREWGSKRK